MGQAFSPPKQFPLSHLHFFISFRKTMKYAESPYPPFFPCSEGHRSAPSSGFNPTLSGKAEQNIKMDG
tara:strand:- start:3550 stop:3753 length:204 start_codon:yes stop_codon:yes gene_type:complete